MGAHHSHGPAPSPEDGHGQGGQRWPADRASLWAVLAVIVPLAVGTLAALVWMWPPDPEPTAPGSEQMRRVTGTIVRVDLKPCPKQQQIEGAPLDVRGIKPAAPPDSRRCGVATVKLTSDAVAGRAVTAELPSGPGSRIFSTGDKVILLEMPAAAASEQDPGGGGADAGAGARSYQLSDHDRSNPLWMVAAAFVLAVIAFGRWRGLTALAGLAITFVLLLWFLIPAILDGRSPLLVAIVCAAAIMLAVLYLTHGVAMTTSIAVIGTLGSLALTGLLATMAINLTKLSGITDESSFYLDYSYSINTQGLLLASIIIGSLGVLDDVTVTQAATVRELAAANPAYRFAQLYRAAARVGRAHIASVINTIVLAYAGASLPMLLLFTISRQPLGEVVTNPVIAQEIVRSVAGTLGLIAAVPLTTTLAAFIAARAANRAALDVHDDECDEPGDLHHHHDAEQDAEGRPDPTPAGEGARPRDRRHGQREGRPPAVPPVPARPAPYTGEAWF